MQRRTAIPHFREPQSGTANFKKGTMPAAYRRRPYCGYGCDFGYDDAPGPGCRDYPRHDLLRDGTPHSQPRPHLLQVPARHSSHRRAHGSDHAPPLRPFPPRPAPLRPRRPPRPEKAAGLYSGPAPTASGKDNFGISRSINSSIRWNFPCSSPFTKVTARPVALARAVRPMRWM